MITDNNRDKGVLSLTLPQGIQCKWQIVKMHYFAIQLVNDFVNDHLMRYISKSFKLNVFIESGGQWTKTWKMSVHIDQLMVLNQHKDSIMLIRSAEAVHLVRLMLSVDCEYVL